MSVSGVVCGYWQDDRVVGGLYASVKVGIWQVDDAKVWAEGPVTALYKPVRQTFEPVVSGYLSDVNACEASRLKTVADSSPSNYVLSLAYLKGRGTVAKPSRLLKKVAGQRRKLVL